MLSSAAVIAPMYRGTRLAYNSGPSTGTPTIRGIPHGRNDPLLTVVDFTRRIAGAVVRWRNARCRYRHQLVAVRRRRHGCVQELARRSARTHPRDRSKTRGGRQRGGWARRSRHGRRRPRREAQRADESLGAGRQQGCARRSHPMQQRCRIFWRRAGGGPRDLQDRAGSGGRGEGYRRASAGEDLPGKWPARRRRPR
jgi:hypothetical protein